MPFCQPSLLQLQQRFVIDQYGSSEMILQDQVIGSEKPYPALQQFDHKLGRYDWLQPFP